jgi:CubicO group peptidase (beta-lactamase class C family)
VSVLTSRTDGVPLPLEDGWDIASLSQGGFDAGALCRTILAGATPQANLHSVVLARRGKLLAEFYFTGPDKPLGAWWTRNTRFAADVKHDLRSISKGVVGLLVGIAQAQGKIASLQAPVLDYFPQFAHADAPERRLITLEHLLTMTAGLEWNEGRMNRARRRERYILDRPVVAVPGSRFSYSGGTTVLLASILEKVTQMPLAAYARESLFVPLGIGDVAWKADGRGQAMAFTGLRMRPRDLAKIGQMLVDGGRWQGKQVVPQDWVRASLQPHVSTGDGLQYGYQWWVSATAGSSTQHTWAAAFGQGGQRLFIVPALELSLVMTAGRYSQSSSGRGANDLFRRVLSAAQA